MKERITAQFALIILWIVVLHQIANAAGEPPAGSLANAIAINVDSRIAGKSFATASPLWSTRGDTPANYVWNKDSWLRGVDMTCVSPWNSVGGATRTVTAITPDAVIGAKHYSPPVGADVRFVGPNNLFYTRRIVKEANPASDIWIGLLDSPLPPTITPAKCLGKYTPQFMPPSVVPNNWRVPVCGLNQFKQAIVCDFNVVTKTGEQMIRVPINPQRLAFYRPLIVGDSGSPYFFIINNQPVILGCWWSSMGGPSVQYYRGLINDSLIMMGSRYKMQAIKL